jgi:hypothetical protein
MKREAEKTHNRRRKITSYAGKNIIVEPHAHHFTIYLEKSENYFCFFALLRNILLMLWTKAHFWSKN